MTRRDELIAGLDIGTTKVTAVVGRLTDAGRLAVLGVGTRPSVGISKGAVCNVDCTVDAIQGALEDAELMADCELHSIHLGIACGQVKSFNSHGIVAIKDGEVRTNDKRRVIEAARTVALPVDRDVLHVLPMGYVVDDHGGIADPLGIKGVRLEVNCHIVTVPGATRATLVNCVRRAGLRVDDVVLDPLAGAEAVLSQAEKDMGAVLVDIGGGTTDIAVVVGGFVRHTAVLALGGNHISADINKILRTPIGTAEQMKVVHGAALASEVADESISVPNLAGDGEHVISRQVLCGIIEKRVEEILELVRREVEKSGYDRSLTAGLVLTGGTARLPGIDRLARRVFDIPVRLGEPRGLEGLDDQVDGPEYATAVGLVLYGAMSEQVRETPLGAERGLGAVLDRMKGWFSDFF